MIVCRHCDEQVFVEEAETAVVHPDGGSLAWFHRRCWIEIIADEHHEAPDV